jgi:aquaporin Z
MTLAKRTTAEFLGTFWLVLGGCGSAVLAAAFPGLGIGFLGVALASGLTVVTTARRIPSQDVIPYVVAGRRCDHRRRDPLRDRERQAGLRRRASGFATNGFGAHSPGGYWLVAGLVCEIVMTFFFLFVILGATDKRAAQELAPLAIGLTLTVIHLVSIPVTNTSVNPARSTGPALFAGAWAMEQLWLFWVAPIAGAVIAGLVHRVLTSEAPMLAPRPVPAT